jgi:hypothetical protein
MRLSPLTTALAVTAAALLPALTLAAERAGHEPPTALAGGTQPRPSQDGPRHGRPPWSSPAPPNVEIVLPLEPADTSRCADQDRYRSRARVIGSERFERRTSGAMPPADLGC